MAQDLAAGRTKGLLGRGCSSSKRRRRDEVTRGMKSGSSMAARQGRRRLIRAPGYGLLEAVFQEERQTQAQAQQEPAPTGRKEERSKTTQVEARHLVSLFPGEQQE